MKKLIYLLLVVFASTACDEQNIENNQKEPVASTENYIMYPVHEGSAGDSVTGFLGYGYDGTGLCDYVSVKEKVLDNFQEQAITHYPTTTYPVLFYGDSFAELIQNINNQSKTAIESHLKTLIELAKKRDSIDLNAQFIYYSSISLKSNSVLPMFTDYTEFVTDNFKNDLTALSAGELVSKYGTHVLTNVCTGRKFEVLFQINDRVKIAEEEAKLLFNDRMKEFAGGIPGIIYGSSSTTKPAMGTEKLICNSIGSLHKINTCISATDHNPDSISIDLNSVFSAENFRPALIQIDENGLLPIYELINDETKKAEVKEYIEKK